MAVGKRGCQKDSFSSEIGAGVHLFPDAGGVPAQLFDTDICLKKHLFGTFSCQRPYHAEYTSSRPITEVKQRRAQSVLGWVTAWEHWVLLALLFLLLANVLAFTLVQYFGL